jgi:hypothetical protein
MVRALRDLPERTQRSRSIRSAPLSAQRTYRRLRSCRTLGKTRDHGRLPPAVAHRARDRLVRGHRPEATVPGSASPGGPSPEMSATPGDQNFP